jgi:serralysin
LKTAFAGTGKGSVQLKQEAIMAETYTVINADPNIGTGYINAVADLADMVSGIYSVVSDQLYLLYSSTYFYAFSGTNFEYDINGVPIAGAITSFSSYDIATGLELTRYTFESPVSQSDFNQMFVDYQAAGNDRTIFENFFAASATHIGSSGGDRIYGNIGGQDTMLGGDGSDTYYANEFNDIITETNTVLTTGGDDLVYYSGTTGTFTLGNNLERLTLTGSGATAGIGNTLANTIVGNSGANTLSGLGGIDKLNGGLGSDTMIGGDSTDYYYVNVTTDIVTETNAVLTTGGNDLVYFAGTSGTFTLSANVERIYLTGSSAISGTGNELANTLKGNTAANTLSGLAGNDIIDGGLGRDTMIGGTGNDTYYADVFNDVVSETSPFLVTGGTDTVIFSGADGTYVLSNFVENLTLAGTGSIGGTGNSSANTIIGNTGANEISGRVGNDTLTGGTGTDVFVFDTALDASTNIDTITDYNVADDTIGLDNAIFTTLGLATDTLTSAMFKNVTLSAVDTNDRIIYNDATGAVFYDVDGSGVAFAAIQFATLTASPTLNFEDFFVF